MRIAILAHNLRGGGGISVGRNIISSMARLAPDNHYLISFPPNLGYEEIITGISDCEQVVFRHGGNRLKRWLFDYRKLPKMIESWKPDAVLGLGNMGLYGNSAFPQAILCQNSYLCYNRRHFGRTTKLTFRVFVWLQKRRLAKDLRNTQLLLCQTRAAAERIQKAYGYKGKTAIFPNAVSSFTLNENGRDEMPAALIPYRDCMKLFYLTTYYPHKNIEILVDMFDRYRDELSSTALFLTLANDGNPCVSRLWKTIEQKGLSDRIINLGPLPQQSLAEHFHHVDALLMPTLLESFSGSYIEAMHFGVPILTSDYDFAHEVCGDSALYFDPLNAKIIKDAILKLKNSPKLAQDLIAKGKRQLQSKFRSWDEITENLLKNLQAIAVA